MNSDTAQRVIPAPLLNPESKRFFDAAREGVLLIGKCLECGEHHMYPRVLCPHCFSDRTQWLPSSGVGTIYTYSTLHRGVPVPYTIAYVTLSEGVSMMTNIVDCDPANLRIGQGVHVVFKSAEDGSMVPMFTPD